MKREDEPFVGESGANIFVFDRPLTRLEGEALMRFETWTRWERYWWRVRLWWARLRGTDTCR